MSKILYPVGTQVTLRKFPEAGVFEVVEYKKGEKFPYRVENEFGDSGANGKTKFSVKGLKRYNPTQAKATQTSSDVASPKQTPTQEKCTCYTKDQVDELLAQVYDDMGELLRQVQHASQEDLNRVARTVDTNFCRVSKQFKTLNHDDD